MNNYHYPPFQPGTIYHVYNHANGFDDLFLRPHHFTKFLNKMKRRLEPVMEILAYCLLDNHFHFVIRCRPEGVVFDLAAKTRSVKGVPFVFPELLAPADRYHYFVNRQLTNFLIGYSKMFNSTANRRGSLFLKGTPRKVVSEHDYLLSVLRYVHLNAIKHGIVQHPDQWIHTSFHAFAGLDCTLDIPVTEIWDWYGGQANFERMHRDRRRVFVVDLEPVGLHIPPDAIIVPAASF